MEHTTTRWGVTTDSHKYLGIWGESIHVENVVHSVEHEEAYVKCDHLAEKKHLNNMVYIVRVML